MTTNEFRLNLIQQVYISKACLFYFTLVYQSDRVCAGRSPIINHRLYRFIKVPLCLCSPSCYRYEIHRVGDRVMFAGLSFFPKGLPGARRGSGSAVRPRPAAEKHPKYLFDKKTMKDMQKEGSVSSYSSKRRNTAPTIPLPGKGANGKESTNTPADSLHMSTDSTRSPIDSSHSPIDTTHSR